MARRRRRQVLRRLRVCFPKLRVACVSDLFAHGVVVEINST